MGESLQDSECIDPEIAFWRGIGRSKPGEAGKVQHDSMDNGAGGESRWYV